MASAQSHGLHQPSALSYLVSEEILPVDPSPDQYEWRTICTDESLLSDGPEEEILQTKDCVVWSQGGVVKRVFRLGIEREPILQALTTNFPTGTAAARAQARYKPPASRNAVDTSSKDTQAHQSTVHPVSYAQAEDASSYAEIDTGSSEASERALVVVLATQAYVYMASGDNYIVPVPFEVQHAFSAVKGVVLVRKRSAIHPSSFQIAPPQNSFISSQPSAGLRSSQTQLLTTGYQSRPSLTISTAPDCKLVPSIKADVDLPSLFTLTDPQSQLGLVVASSTDRGRDRGGFVPLDNDEELQYLSSSNELHFESSTGPLFLAVTSNSKTNTFTLWKVRYYEPDDPFTELGGRQRTTSGYVSRRRSSNVFGMGTGANTPGGNTGGGVRESFGGLSESMSQPGPKIHSKEKASEEETLVSQLGAEFGERGVQTRAARRVSSLLSRTELATSHDRATFQELNGNVPNRPSMGKPGRRGESFGSFGERTSFGRRRSSHQGDTSLLSAGSSFLDAPVDHLLEELNNSGSFQGFDQMGLKDNLFDYPREMLFSKVESFPQSATGRPNRSDPTKRPRVFITRWPTSVSALLDATFQRLSLCIHDPHSCELLVLELKVKKHISGHETASSKRLKSSTLKRPEISLTVQASDFRRGYDIADAIKVADHDICRIVTLTKSREGLSVLHLEAPWSVSYRLDPPHKLRVHDPFTVISSNSPERWQEGSRKRIFGSFPSHLKGLQCSSSSGRFDVVDQHDRWHRVRLQLRPHNFQVEKILAASALVLCDNAGQGLIVAWWEILRWLRQDLTKSDAEWTAMVVLLFCLAVPYLPNTEIRKSREKLQGKNSTNRRQSTKLSDVSSWIQALYGESQETSVLPHFQEKPAWNWVDSEFPDIYRSVPPENSPTNARRSSNTVLEATSRSSHIQSYVQLAREFLKTPAGKHAIGVEGYLPTALSQPRGARQTALAKILISLHLLNEEDKLDVRSNDVHQGTNRLLSPVIAQIGAWLGWQGWDWKSDSYFSPELQNLEGWLFDDSRITTIETPEQPFDPPSIFSYVEQCFTSVQSDLFFNLVDIVAGSMKNFPKHNLALIQKAAAQLTPISFSVTRLFAEISTEPSRLRRMESIFRAGLSAGAVHMLPDGMSPAILGTLVACQSRPPNSWVERLVDFVDREDLLMVTYDDSSHAPVTKSRSQVSHDATRDLHLTGNSAADTDAFHSFDATAEADRVTLTRLIFREDRRFQDATRLVNQLKAPVAECIPEPDWSEADLLEAQRELVQLVTMRTLAVSSGRGMIQYNARVPLLTERVHIPAFTLQCRMRPSNITLNAERASITEDKVCWAFFHNGASTGLTISKTAKGIDTSWILYNKPNDLTNRHAGFLLALGLNGHLRNLAKWVAFKYLTPKHTMTSIGLLLGLSTSYIGTMDTLITRLLSVHVTRMLPPGAAELNLSPLTQTTGLMGIGLLYCGSQHRRMSEVMISEIENTSVEESPMDVLRDEGYRLAAGFSLGFINLGRGSNLQGLHDMNITERLLSLAVSTRDVNIVHVLDRATAGATIALALIFMKTNDKAIARKIDIPDTVHQFGYVRADMFLLRTVAKNLILWRDIRPTHAFIRSSLPKNYRFRSTLRNIRNLVTDDLPLFNIIAGLLLSVGLRYAGSGSHQVRDLLLLYLDQYIRLTRLTASDYDARLTRNSVRNCQDAVALALSAVMAGTGDLLVLRRLRSLHGRLDPDTTYGSHLAAHMALGALFLGGGTHTFGTNNVAVASLLCAFYPVFPISVLDNKSHLQAFRHLWVLATEARCLVTRDMDSRRPISVRAELTMTDKSTRFVTTPCLLPDLADVQMLRILVQEYWDMTLDFDQKLGDDGEKNTAMIYSRISALYLSRRAAYDAPTSSVFVSALQALDDADPAPGVSSVPTAATTSHAAKPSTNPFEWLWNLDRLKGLDVAERALVLPPQGHGARGLRGTVVDTRLSLENGTLPPEKSGEGRRKMQVGPMSRDKLWQLRLLIAWVDWEERMEIGISKEDVGGLNCSAKAGGVWLRKEVVEGLKWRVWRIVAEADEGPA